MKGLLLRAVTFVGETVAGERIKVFLEQKFPRLFRNKTREIIEEYENRLDAQNEQIAIREAEIGALEVAGRQAVGAQGHMARALKRRSISVEKLLDRYHRPLRAILVTYSAQHRTSDNGRVERSAFIRAELERFGARSLGGNVIIVPPRHVPANIKDRAGLKLWFEEEILRGRFCRINLALIDLRMSTYWGTYLPYISIRPFHRTIGEVLSADDVFTDEQMRGIALADVISSGDVAWLASAVVGEDELDIIIRNQATIEESLGRPSLRLLAKDEMHDRLVESLRDFVDEPADIARRIIEEAGFWHGQLSAP